MASAINRLKHGLSFICTNRKTGTKERVELQVHHNKARSCCENIVVRCYPHLEEIPEIELISWQQISKNELPQEIRQKFEDDKAYPGGCDLLAIKSSFSNGTPLYLIVANKGNGNYCHRATIVSSIRGVITDTSI